LEQRKIDLIGNKKKIGEKIGGEKKLEVIWSRKKLI